jgi:beta-glucanase (GH16 family)
LETAASEWKLVWSDEFNGSEIDRNKWDLERGSGFMAPGTNEWLAGWGNNELDFYTERPENTWIQDGMLHVRAIKEVYKGCEYTSARLTTRGRFNKKYGRFEFRANLPTGKGILPRCPS